MDQMLRVLNFCPENMACASLNSDRHLCPVSGLMAPPLTQTAWGCCHLSVPVQGPALSRLPLSRRNSLLFACCSQVISCKTLSSICTDGHMWFVSRNLFSPCQKWHLVIGAICASIYNTALEGCFPVWLSTTIKSGQFQQDWNLFQYINFINLINLCFLNLRE